MPTILPPNRPKASREDLLKALQSCGVDPQKLTNPSLVAWRGYFRQSMGRKDQNDFDIYDDACFWLAPDTFRGFNFNTDPYGYHKGVAILKPGVYKYMIGNHNSVALGPYPAFRQYEPVTVMRPSDDKQGDKMTDDTGMFGINLHKGGLTKTSSLGCQTWPPSQWLEARQLGYDLIHHANLKWFNYVLIEPKASVVSPA